jgi:acyl carrier protein
MKAEKVPKINIDKLVNEKIRALSKTQKTFRDIYTLMFRDEHFVMFERLRGGKIEKTTYGECKKGVEKLSGALREQLQGLKGSGYIGLYAENSMAWVQAFWAILKNGYTPLLLNTRMDIHRLQETLAPYEVVAVLSNGQEFSVPTFSLSELVKRAENYAGEIPDTWADEIVVMSSGTSLTAKLCVYKGENFYYQLVDSANIIRESKAIKKHYKGELKQLTFLPLYHIFGLAAMFMWFAFFSRTFVELKDQNPETILYTIRKHKVTHIFAVPLFWNVVYRLFRAELKKQGETMQRKYEKAMSLVQKTGWNFLSKLFFKSVREKIFGESICFLISGGSVISTEVLRFFNGIGYHLANGYGMSEVGITSVELSAKKAFLCDGAVGKPFSHIQYKIDDKGELLVQGKSTATYIYTDGVKEELTGKWFHTCDKAIEKNGRYFIRGRADDVMIGADGENINPEWSEKQIRIDGSENHALVMRDGVATLIIQIKKFTSAQKREQLRTIAQAELAKLHLSSAVQSVRFTEEPLLGENDFKRNCRRLQSLALIDEELAVSKAEQADGIASKVRECFAKTLGVVAETIDDDAHFFFDLKGSSLDYFALLSALQAEFLVDCPRVGDTCLYTVSGFAGYINENV